MMYRNALEEEVRVKLFRLRQLLNEHDRGVLIGLLLGLIPIPPVALLGLVVSLYNFRLIRRSALPERESRLVRAAIIASCISLVIGIALFAVIGWIVVHTLSAVFPRAFRWVQDLMDWLPLTPPRAPSRGYQSI